MSDNTNALKVAAERYLSSCDEYTDPYEREKLIRDWIKKPAVAQKVVAGFEERVGKLTGSILLDVGFGNGQYAVAFAEAGAEVHGLEVNETLLSVAREIVMAEKVQADLRLYDGETFPFPDSYFDYAFSVSVLEHVSDPHAMLMETARVLKQGGKCYLAFPNRWRPKETHTGVWFLSYLPRSAAQFFLRTFGKRNAIEELNLHFVSFWSLKRFLRGTGLVIVHEEEKGSAPRRMLKRTLNFFGIHHSAILGTVMVVLEKSA